MKNGMKKHYAVGMFGGKFLPYHRGHLYCLEVASGMCDQVWQVLTAGGVEEEAFLRGLSPGGKDPLQFPERAPPHAGGGETGWAM